MLVLLAAACADGTPVDPLEGLPPVEPAVPGAFDLSFQLDPDLVPDMAEPAAGAVLGAVYDEADATATGPVDGAVPLYDYVTASLDLTDGAVSASAAETPLLDAPVVWLLACLDGNADGCGCGDPVTVPNANKVRVIGGVTTPIVVTFDLLHPC
jgi:hypothetical protein